MNQGKGHGIVLRIVGAAILFCLLIVLSVWLLPTGDSPRREEASSQSEGAIRPRPRPTRGNAPAGMAQPDTGGAVPNSAVPDPAGVTSSPDASGPQPRRLTAAGRRQLQTILAAKRELPAHLRKVSAALLPVSWRTRLGMMEHAAGPLDVVVRAPVEPAVLDEIVAQGGTVRSTLEKYNWIRATVPETAIEPLAKLDAVASIRLYLPPICSKTNTSQGDVAHRAALARDADAFGVDGSGITVGVISDSASPTQLATLIASGDLPDADSSGPRVSALDGQDGTNVSGYTDEGLAMLEIIYDLAPGAKLYFATCGESEEVFAENIRALRTAGCNVIVDDISFLLEPVFQDGIIAQAVEDVVADGAVYLSAAGNFGSVDQGTSGVWEGDFRLSQTTTINSYEYETHDFGDGDLIRITDTTNYVILKWSDAYGSSGNDYDLFLIAPDGSTVVDWSWDWQNGNDNPEEYLVETMNLRGYYLVVARVLDAATRYIHLNLNGGTLENGTSGQIFTHAAAESCLAVAAVDVADAAGGVFNGNEPVEYYSSDGPRRVFYRADGTAITTGVFTAAGGEVRSKPDLAAADGVSCATAGFGTFYGTSAAAPHAAAIAALLIQQNPGITPAQVRKSLVAGALDMEDAGWDRSSGYGVLDAYAVLGTTPDSSPTPPEGVSASDQAYPDRVAVTWYTSPWATHYRVYRSTSLSETATAVSDWQTAVSFEDTTVAHGTPYYYWVEAATGSEGENPSGLGTPDQGETTPAPQSLAVSGPATIDEGTTGTYACTVTYTDGSTADRTAEASWSVTDTYASIDDTGLVTAIGVPSDQSATVMASYTENDVTVDGSLGITIGDLPGTTYSLTVSGGTGSGDYSAGTLVAVAATPPEGLRLASWTADPTDYQGNLADASASSTVFTMPLAAAALSYTTAEGTWAVPLTLTGATPATVTLGTQATATDGYDVGIDELGSLPEAGQAALASDTLSLAYVADYRYPAETCEFLLIASADTDPITVTWDLTGFPTNRFLCLYEVQLDNIAPSATPVTKHLVGNTALNLRWADSLTIPAGETRCYVVRYGSDVVYDLGLVWGWNLVSLPLEPADPAVSAILDDGQTRSAVQRGEVWQWQTPDYVTTSEMHACTGYWVYVSTATALLVTGSPVNQTGLDLASGWNLSGAERSWLVPADARIVVTPTYWDATLLRYQAASRFYPGYGYWIYASESAVVPLSAR